MWAMIAPVLYGRSIHALRMLAGSQPLLRPLQRYRLRSRSSGIPSVPGLLFEESGMASGHSTIIPTFQTKGGCHSKPSLRQKYRSGWRRRMTWSIASDRLTAGTSNGSILFLLRTFLNSNGSPLLSHPVFRCGWWASRQRPTAFYLLTG